MAKRFRIDFTDDRCRRSRTKVAADENAEQPAVDFIATVVGDDRLIDSKTFGEKGVAHEIFIIDQHGPELMAISDEKGVARELCGFVSCGVAVLLAERPFRLNAATLRAIMRDLCDPSVMVPAVRHVAAHVVALRERDDDENIRNFVGAFEVSDFLRSGVDWRKL